ncbi:MAG: hypothetical protein IK088_03395, partial [Lachnospiraceae bacterium]|nr:hypothetical protein [Lachnospiraceae bacterium]
MKKQHFWLLATLAAVILGLVSLSGAVRTEASGEAKLSTTTSAVIGDKFELRLGFEEGTYTASDLRLVVSKRYGDEVIEPQGTIFHIPLNPEELTIDLQPRLMYGDTELDRRTTPYTGALFAKTLAGLDWMGADVKEMLADLLEYGAAAQNYYNYRTDDPANAEAYRWDGYQPTAFQAPQPSAVTVTKEGTGVTLRSANLYLEGDTIAVQFRGTSPDNAVYTLNGTAVTPATYDAGNFMVRSAAIKMSEIPDASYTLRVSDGTNWSEVTYSVANYIANKTSDAYAATGNPYMVELAKRLWAYGGKANYVYENMTGTDYTIKFLDIDGAVLSDGTYSYGEAVAVPADQTRTANGYTYTFNGWGSTVSTVAVGDAVYKASFKAGDIVLDFDWYGDGSADTFTLEDPEDLYAFALISQTKNFAGKTVELGADIDLNPAWTASATAPANAWDSAIGNTNLPFAGTFDGKGHTIKGVYFSGTAAPQGFFRQTASTAVLQNFYLKNSYMKLNTGSAGANGFGSIAGLGAGTFKNIYSEAIVDAYLQRVGGLIGQTAGAVTIEDCWYAGKADIRTNSSYIGGLIGDIINKTTIANSMNTADVTLNASPGTTGVGGFIGHIASGVTVTITDSVNHGKPSQAKTSDDMLGLMVGYNQGTLTLQNCHSVLYKGYQNANNLTLVRGATDPSDCSRQNKADVAGTKSLTTAKVSNLFSSDTAKGHWVCSTDSLPILAAFE